jgi:hypothetical protein
VPWPSSESTKCSFAASLPVRVRTQTDYDDKFLGCLATAECRVLEDVPQVLSIDYGREQCRIIILLAPQEVA